MSAPNTYKLRWMNGQRHGQGMLHTNGIVARLQAPPRVPGLGPYVGIDYYHRGDGNVLLPARALWQSAAQEAPGDLWRELNPAECQLIHAWLVRLGENFHHAISSGSGNVYAGPERRSAERLAALLMPKP